MRLTRAFIDAPLAAGMRVTLPESAASHLVRVLRLRVGDDFVLFNGDGHDYRAKLVEVVKRGATAEVTVSCAIDNESPLRIVLLQGIARGEKMDLILQKATELGVAHIVPVDAERTEVRLDGERLRKRVAHWRSVVVSACEQCGRTRIPQVSEPVDINAVGPHAQGALLRLILDPNGQHVLPALRIAAPATVAIAIGPEGGWSPRDRDALRAAGFEGLRLGPRILRTETAGLAAVAALQAIHGDLAR